MEEEAEPYQAGPVAKVAPLQVWGGIECTINRVGDHYHSQLDRSGHRGRIGDLDRVAALGIRTLRYPVLWEDVTPNEPGQHDWNWTDQRMKRLRELGIEPIAGLLHHGSGPRYTSLVDPEFPRLFAAHARAVAERYPWIEAYTPVNEPLTTARFSGLYGHWYPHGRDSATFGRALLGQLRGVVLAMRAIREVNSRARLVQTEDLGRTFSTPAFAAVADFDNERRWLSFDLLTGRMNRDHAMWEYLLSAGLTADELAVFQDEPCPPDVIGINHYVTSDRHIDEISDRYPPWAHGGNGRIAYSDLEAVRARPDGISRPGELLREAWQRYGKPIAITEAQMACTREEQIRWFAEAWHGALKAREAGAEVVAVTAWALFGAHDWASLLTKNEGRYESGAFDLRAPQPRPTALAHLLKRLAAGGAADHPALAGPGWWRRRMRLLPSLDPALREENRTPELPEEVRRAYAARRAAAFAPGQAGGGEKIMLITGGHGALGQAFARLCHLRGLSYRLLTREEMRLAEPSSIQRVMEAFSPWAVIHANGYAHVDEAEADRAGCFHENAEEPENLASACAGHGVSFVAFSSALVFNGEKTGPYVESDAVAPLNVYGESQAAMESRVATLCPRALIVRSGACFDPWHEDHPAARALAAARAGQLFLAADDLQVSPAYLPDVVHATLDLLLDGERGLWHLAHEESVTPAELARRVVSRAGLDASLVQGVAQASLGAAARRPRQGALASERGQIMPGLDAALNCYLGDAAAYAARTAPVRT